MFDVVFRKLLEETFFFCKTINFFCEIAFSVAAANRAASDWSISIQNKVLMPDPHTETGSQDVVVISATESLVSLHGVTALRFLLRQPSPNWKSFNVEEIAVKQPNYFHSPDLSSNHG